MQEFSFLQDIEFDLEGNPFAVRARTEAVFNQPYKAIIDTRLAEYRNQLAATPSAVLQRTARIRASELSGHYAAALRHEQAQGSKDAADRKRIAALSALSAGFIAASIVEYTDRKISGFIEAFTPSIQQEDIERIAASAESQGITDAATFRELFNALEKVGKIQDKPVLRPKDAILNNGTAVAMLNKMRDLGMLDATYQWRDTDNQGKRIRHTQFEKAVFADAIGKKASIIDWDKAFSDLWGLKHRILTRRFSDLNNLSETKRLEYIRMVDTTF